MDSTQQIDITYQQGKKDPNGVMGVIFHQNKEGEPPCQEIITVTVKILNPKTENEPVEKAVPVPQKAAMWEFSYPYPTLMIGHCGILSIKVQFALGIRLRYWIANFVRWILRRRKHPGIRMMLHLYHGQNNKFVEKGLWVDPWCDHNKYIQFCKIIKTEDRYYDDYEKVHPSAPAEIYKEPDEPAEEAAEAKPIAVEKKPTPASNKGKQADQNRKAEMRRRERRNQYEHHRKGSGRKAAANNRRSLRERKPQED